MERSEFFISVLRVSGLIPFARSRKPIEILEYSYMYCHVRIRPREKLARFLEKVVERLIDF
jgi:hypothetical protein